MYGNLINNRQIKELIKTRVIEIVPFIEKNLSTAHLTLHIGKVLVKLPTGNFKTIHNFAENEAPYILGKDAYIIVECLELIKLNDENIVGEFIPASNLIADGLSLTAGKIDKEYGNLGPKGGCEPEKVQFGLKNNTNDYFTLPKNYRVAHLELFDLRGVASEKVELSIEEKMAIVKRFRKESDDGPTYSMDDDDD